MRTCSLTNPANPNASHVSSTNGSPPYDVSASPVSSSISLNGNNADFSPLEKHKATLYGIKAVSPNSYAKGEERPYGNTVYNRTDGIPSTGAAICNRQI